MRTKELSLPAAFDFSPQLDFEKGQIWRWKSGIGHHWWQL